MSRRRGLAFKAGMGGPRLQEAAAADKPSWPTTMALQNSPEETDMTSCPILSGLNCTYEFQVKDQIGNFFYSPSVGLQRAGAVLGGIAVSTTATPSQYPSVFIRN